MFPVRQRIALTALKLHPIAYVLTPDLASYPRPPQCSCDFLHDIPHIQRIHERVQAERSTLIALVLLPGGLVIYVTSTLMCIWTPRVCPQMYQGYDAELETQHCRRQTLSEILVVDLLSRLYYVVVEGVVMWCSQQIDNEL